MTTPRQQLKKANDAIQFFEDTGKTVVGVVIGDDEIRLEFERPEDKVDPVGLVNMGQK